MNKFKVGDFIFNLTENYYVTSYREFFVGMVIKVQEDGYVIILPVYCNRNSSIIRSINRIKNPTTRRNVYDRNFERELLPAFYKILTSNDEAIVSEAQVMIQVYGDTHPFASYRVLSEHFNLLSLNNIESSFDVMRQIQISEMSFSPHNEFNSDFRLIQQDYVSNITSLLKKSIHVKNSTFFSSIPSHISW